MGNGFAGHGFLEIRQQEGVATVVVQSQWTRSDDWVTLKINVPGAGRYELDMDNDEACHLAAMLLDGAGREDLAVTIPADMALREAKRRIFDDARDAMHQAQRAAQAAFFEATREQREAYDAALRDVEDRYAQTVGDDAREYLTRSVDLRNPETASPF